MDCRTDMQAAVYAVVPEFPDSMPALAMVYSPQQTWEAPYEADRGLARGTIFPSLDKPFLEGACPNV